MSTNYDLIKANFIKKTDDELLDILRQDNHEEWSEEAFNSIHEILIERKVEVPQELKDKIAESPTLNENIKDINDQNAVGKKRYDPGGFRAVFIDSLLLTWNHNLVIIISYVVGIASGLIYYFFVPEYKGEGFSLILRTIMFPAFLAYIYWEYPILILLGGVALLAGAFKGIGTGFYYEVVSLIVAVVLFEIAKHKTQKPKNKKEL